MRIIKDKFGTVIAGFFSDEPELGNSYYCNRKNRLGEDPNLDLCWSDSLERELERALGQEYKNYLPLLWKNDGDGALYLYGLRDAPRRKQLF